MSDTIYSFTYANEVARKSATGLTRDDCGKLAIQTDNNSLWMLVKQSPVTWQDISSNHPVYVFTYIDADHRLSATGLTTGDIGKLALQNDDKSLWMLTSDRPVTWKDISAYYAFTYANETARLAATGFTSSHIGKIALQTNDDSLWMLINYNPITWKNISINSAPYSFVYTSANNRLSARGFTINDVGKLALQSDNESLWMLTKHSPITWKNISSSYSFTYANATNRINTTGFTVDDIGKLALQIDDKSLWILTNYNPVAWKDINSSGTSVTNISVSFPIVSSGGDVPNISIPAATITNDGYMTAAQASKLAGLSGAYIPVSDKGASNGVATLIAGKVPADQLPSYVDDVLEYANSNTFPVSGNTGVIYVAQDTNKIYRWSGSGYIEISSAVSNADHATTADTATNATIHIAQVTGNPHQVTKIDVGLGNVLNVAQIPTSEKGANNGVATLNATGKVIQTALNADNATTHIAKITGNPHQVTKAEVGLGNVDNFAQIPAYQKGANNGVATLNDAGKVVQTALNADNATSASHATNAEQLTNGRNIKLEGDVTGSVQFNGANDVIINATLADSGVFAGNYKSVKVDNKGRVTNGANPTTLDGYGITDAASKTHNHPEITISSLGAADVNHNHAVDNLNNVSTDNKINGDVLRWDGANWINTNFLIDGKLNPTLIPDSLTSGVEYKGTWDANTNNPVLVSGTGTKGHYYKVGIAGNTNLDGISTWQISDTVIFNGSTWKKVEAPSSEVNSVNGQTGTVLLTTANINDDIDKKYVTDTQKLALDNMGNASGVALLDLNKKVPEAQNASTLQGHVASYFETADSQIRVHITSPHAPANAQKNSDITQTEIEAKLRGTINSHSHTVTKADVGLTNVLNIAQEAADPNIHLHITSPHAPSDAQKNSSILKDEIEAKLTGVISSHGHVVTKADVGLSKVLDVEQIPASEKGISIATLDENGHVPALQLDLTNITASDIIFDPAGTSLNPATQVQAAIQKLDTIVTDISNIIGPSSELKVIATSLIGAKNGVASLDGNQKIPQSQLPALALTNTFVEDSEAKMLGLAANVGDMCIRTDINKSFILKSSNPQDLSSWQEILVPLAGVAHVTASLPMFSSGGDNPNISMPVASEDNDGYMAIDQVKAIKNNTTELLKMPNKADKTWVIDREQAKILLCPEYPNMVFSALGMTNTLGILTTEHSIEDNLNYYQWVSTEAIAQSYGIVIMIPKPKLLNTWTACKLLYKGLQANPVTMTIYDTTGIQAGTATGDINGEWSSLEITDLGTLNEKDWSGEMFKVIIKVESASNKNVWISNLRLEYTLQS